MFFVFFFEKKKKKKKYAAKQETRETCKTIVLTKATWLWIRLNTGGFVMKRHASHPRANRESWGEKKGRFLTRDSETRARRSLITARDTGRYTACWLLYDTFRDHGIT